MTTTTISFPEHATAARWRVPAALVALIAGSVLAWNGSAWGLLGAALIAAGVAALTSRSLPVTDADDAAESAAAAGTSHAVPGRAGAEVMVAKVVPVWGRQLENTRTVASDGLSNVLQVFSDMSGALNTLTDQLSSFSVSAEPGAVDGAVRRESPALDALSAASARAFAERDAAVAELGRCTDGLAALQQQAKQAREIARHARLVAFNASIEANRNRTQADGGSQAVAVELRMLADRMAQSSEAIERLVHRMTGSITAERRRGEVGDTSPEELRLEIDLRAREAMNALLGSLGASVQGSGEVQQASASLRDQIDNAFLHFQFGDRVSQMLSIIGNDMSNFADWVAAHPRATQSDAAEWLAALESSYTMDEQRSHHHGNVHVERSSGVDFF